MTNLPLYVYITFGIAYFYSIILFYYASNRNKKIVLGIFLWSILQSALAIGGFYENTKTVPPRLILLVFPVVVIVISSIFSTKMKHWLSLLNLKYLTYLHATRILVEIVLFWLFIGAYVPESMTFEGHNFDIIAGLTAPIIALIAFRKNKINRPLLLVWNSFSIILLANILVIAVLSAPTIFQKFAFETPNIAVFHFPFLLLPAIIVPLVLLSHIASFSQLKTKK